MTGPPRRRLRPRTLRGQLTVGLVLILVAASAVLGVATALFLRSFLVDRLDQQLAEAGGRYSAGLERGQGTNDGDADNATPGQAEGTVGVRLLNGKVTNAAIVTPQGKNRNLDFSAGDVAALRELVPGGSARSEDLKTVGDYRLQAVVGRDGDVQITGLPLHPVTETLARLALVEGALFVVILIAGGAVTTLVVRRTMRPLGLLTATATEVSELPLTDADTELPRTVLPSEPASEVDQMSVAFTHMLEHVRKALDERDATERRLRRFIADASHELRTPLATIRANAEYALRADAGNATDAEAEALTRITAATERMANLVDDLLLLARLDAGRPLERQPVDLTRLVLDAVTDARTAAPDHHWRLALPEEIVTVTGDVERLHQVVANLLRNAHNHTPPGTTVSTRLVCADDCVEVSVSDDGPGIRDEDQPELFDRFTRGDTSRSRAHGSTGLGLAIARGIATAHGGTLTLDPAPGGGALFRLRLPNHTKANEHAAADEPSG
ncbi:MAG: histidine kinase [Mycobacterium sp.]|nr:histidine kinase [Mycobacterium sp.]